MEKNAEFRKENFAALGIIASGVIHDINNLLIGIPDSRLLFIYLAEIKKILSKEQEERIKNTLLAFDNCFKSIETTTALGKKLCKIVLSSVKDGSIKKSPSPLPLMLEEVISCARSSIEKLGVKLSCDIDETISDFVCNARMYQIFLNLIGNALYSMIAQHEERKLHISLQRDQHTIFFKIQDSGTGIPSKDLPHIFEMGFKKESDGYGIGLATVCSIIKEHNGKIEVASELGKGTTFIISFPFD